MGSRASAETTNSRCFLAVACRYYLSLSANPGLTAELSWRGRYDGNQPGQEEALVLLWNATLGEQRDVNRVAIFCRPSRLHRK